MRLVQETSSTDKVILGSGPGCEGSVVLHERNAIRGKKKYNLCINVLTKLIKNSQIILE